MAILLIISLVITERRKLLQRNENPNERNVEMRTVMYRLRQEATISIMSRSGQKAPTFRLEAPGVVHHVALAGRHRFQLFLIGICHQDSEGRRKARSMHFKVRSQCGFGCCVAASEKVLGTGFAEVRNDFAD